MNFWEEPKGDWEEHGNWRAIVIDDWILLRDSSRGECRVYFGLKERKWMATFIDTGYSAMPYPGIPKDIEVIARMLARKENK